MQGMAIYESDLRSRLIADAQKATLAHAEAARREKRLADELAVDKQVCDDRVFTTCWCSNPHPPSLPLPPLPQRMHLDFNFFRLRMLGSWIFSNALLAVLVLTYDPRLGVRPPARHPSLLSRLPVG
jgi:hypothetical protein